MITTNISMNNNPYVNSYMGVNFDAPLTREEKALVDEYVEYKEFCDHLLDGFTLLKDGEVAEEKESKGPIKRPDKHFSEFSNVLKCFGITIGNMSDVKAHNPTENLEIGEFTFDSKNNSVTFGIGSSIKLGDYVVDIIDGNIVSYPYGTNPYDENGRLIYTKTPPIVPVGFDLDTHGIGQLIDAINKGNISFSVDEKANERVLSAIKYMGIDTSRPFTINGTAFEVVDGIVQTKDYVEEIPKTMEYLQFLMARAYEQNIIYN